MRFPALAVALSLIAVPAFAQNSAPTTTTAAPAPMTTSPAASEPAASSADTSASTSSASRKHMTMQQRFDAANTTHDGHLTKDQASAGHMRSVVKHFDKIDTDKKGYVTMDDIKTYQKTRRAAKAAKAAKSQ